MDFWAQHKDFILKVLAGVGVFLVALIARGITYGDELENEQARNSLLAREIKSKQIPKVPEILELDAIASRLQENAKTIADQVGWNTGKKGIEQTLLERILRYTRKYARESEANVARAAEEARTAIRENLNGGFGQLRLMVRKELLEEANERNIKAENLGFESVIELDQGELMQYLLQLELVARVARYAIDARVDAMGDIVITTGKSQREVIPGANPDFLQEYEVKLTLTGSEKALGTILNRLEEEMPRPALTGLVLTRLPRPADRLTAEMTLLATASDPEMPFKEKS
jgi:hypothetical protein